MSKITFNLKQQVFLLIICVFSLSANAQYKVWYFGSNSGGTSSAGIDFSGGSPQLINGQSNIAYYESSTVITDASGNLLFYSDGRNIYNKNHQIMQNGGSLTGTQGSNSIASSVQGAFAVRNPADQNKYYLITLRAIDGPANGMRYHEIDMSQNSGLGAVTSKNQLIYNSVTELMTVTGDCQNIWIVAHQINSNNFIKVNIKSDGSINKSKQSLALATDWGPCFAGGSNAGRGSMDFNHDGSKLIMTGMMNIGAWIFDFDKTTGNISNPIEIKNPQGNPGMFYGCEFSPQGNYAYFAGYESWPYGGIFRYNVNAGGSTQWVNNSPRLAEIIEGPDGKLYIGKPIASPSYAADSKYLGVINNPDNANVGSVGFSENGFNIDPLNQGYVASYAMPQSYDCTEQSVVCNTITLSNPSDLCEAANLDLNTLIQNPTPTGGTWSIVSGSGGSLNGNDFSSTQAGNFRLRYTLPGAPIANCPDSGEVDLTVIALPNPAIDPFGPFCKNEAAHTMTANIGGGTWTIDGNASNGTFDPANLSAASHTVVYTVTQNGCTGSDQTNVSVVNNPTPTITQIGPFCESEGAQTLTASISGGSWSINNNPSSNSFDPSSLGSGNHTVDYSVTENGCSGSDQITIVVNSSVSVSIDPLAPLCENDASFILSASISGGTWTVNGNNNNGAIDPSQLGSGTHTIDYSVTQNNCSGSDQTTLTINAKPTPVITPSNTVWCTNDSLFLVASPSTGMNYTWSKNGANGNDDSVKVAGTGPFQLLIENSTTGCKDSTEITLTAQLPQPNLGANIEACAGKVEVLDPSVANIQNYLWSDGSNGSTLSVTVGFGSYWVEVTDNENCVNRDTIEITPANGVSVNIDSLGKICQGELANLSATATGSGTLSYTWSDGTTNSSTSASTSGNYWVIASDAANCRDTDSIVVSFNDNPTVDLGPDTSFCSVGKESYTVYMEVNGQGGLQQGIYSWSPITSTVDSLTITFNPATVIGNYTDSNGCVGSDTLELTEKCEPLEMKVPNVFVPGGDYNPFFNPIGINSDNYNWYVNNTISSKFTVYNRWGRAVHMNYDILPKWDGYYNGQPVPTGTYFYVWEYQDSGMNEYKINGFIQVIQQNNR